MKKQIKAVKCVAATHERIVIKMDLVKRYTALSTWVDKNTNQPKTSLAEIKEGISKSSGQRYQITDTNSTMVIDEFHPVGTIICYTMTANTDSSHKAAPSKA